LKIFKPNNISNKSVNELNERLNVLEEKFKVIASERERKANDEIEARFAKMREERKKTMGPDGWKYETPEEDAYYMQKELKEPPESRYKYFKDAPYWHSPENVNHSHNGPCAPECPFSEPNGRIEDEDVKAYYSIPPAQRPGCFEFYGQRVMKRKLVRM